MKDLKYPGHLHYSRDHEWLEEKGKEVLVGITAFAAGELGDIVYLDFQPVGTLIKAGQIFGTIEAVKTVSDLFMPVEGTIVEINSRATDTPELVNTDPYGEGWLVKIILNDPAEIAELMDAAAYAELTGQA